MADLKRRRQKFLNDYYSDDENEAEINSTISTPIPQKTATQNRWGANIWLEWAKRRNASNIETVDYTPVPEDLQTCNREELGCWLPYLVEEVRRQDGTEYPYNSVYQICCAVKRYVNHNLGEDIDIFNRRDATFVNFNAALDCKMEETANSCYEITPRNAADPVTREDEETLWKTGVFNANTPQGLSFAVFFYNCKLFNVIGKVEHWNLTVDQYTLYFDPEYEKEGIQFQSAFSRQSKSSSRRDKNQKDSIRHIGDPSHPRCVVGIFKKYLSLIPKEGHFYRAPNIRPLDGSITYAGRNIGYNKLRAYLKYMFKLAKIDTSERKITTHSLKGFNSTGDNQSGDCQTQNKSDYLLPLDTILSVPKLSPDHISNGLWSSRVTNSPEENYATMVTADDAYSPRLSSSPENNITVVTPSDDVTMVTSLNRSSWTQTPHPYLRRNKTPEGENDNGSQESKNTEIPKQVKNLIDYVRNTGGGRMSLELNEGIISKIQIDL